MRHTRLLGASNVHVEIQACAALGNGRHMGVFGSIFMAKVFTFVPASLFLPSAWCMQLNSINLLRIGLGTYWGVPEQFPAIQTC